MFRYKHYARDTYRELTHRVSQVVRIQFALNDVGLYEDLRITPSITPSEGGRPMIAVQLQPIGYEYKYYNPDGRWIGFEFLGSDALDYTVDLRVNGIRQTHTISALPVAVPAQFIPSEVIPYTIGGLTGQICHGMLSGAYQSGGVPLGFDGSIVKWVSSLTSLPHRIYRQGNQWRLQLFYADGTEYEQGKNLIGVPMTFDVRGYAR